LCRLGDAARYACQASPGTDSARAWHHLPLFFISGPFGPISFSPGLSGAVISGIAQLFPPYYAIVLQQHAFHDFGLNTLGVGGNALILAIYSLVVVALSALVLRRSTVTS